LLCSLLSHIIVECTPVKEEHNSISSNAQNVQSEQSEQSEQIEQNKPDIINEGTTRRHTSKRTRDWFITAEEQDTAQKEKDDTPRKESELEYEGIPVSDKFYETESEQAGKRMKVNGTPHVTTEIANPANSPLLPITPMPPPASPSRCPEDMDMAVNPCRTRRPNVKWEEVAGLEEAKQAYIGVWWDFSFWQHPQPQRVCSVSTVLSTPVSRKTKILE